MNAATSNGNITITSDDSSDTNSDTDSDNDEGDETSIPGFTMQTTISPVLSNSYITQHTMLPKATYATSAEPKTKLSTVSKSSVEDIAHQAVSNDITHQAASNDIVHQAASNDIAHETASNDIAHQTVSNDIAHDNDIQKVKPKVPSPSNRANSNEDLSADRPQIITSESHSKLLAILAAFIDSGLSDSQPDVLLSISEADAKSQCSIALNKACKDIPCVFNGFVGKFIPYDKPALEFGRIIDCMETCIGAYPVLHNRLDMIHYYLAYNKLWQWESDVGTSSVIYPVDLDVVKASPIFKWSGTDDSSSYYEAMESFREEELPKDVDANNMKPSASLHIETLEYIVSALQHEVVLKVGRIMQMEKAMEKLITLTEQSSNKDEQSLVKDGKDKGAVTKDGKNESTVTKDEWKDKESVTEDEGKHEETVAKDEGKDEETVAKDEGKDGETVAKVRKDEETVSRDEGIDEEAVVEDEGKDEETVVEDEGKDEKTVSRDEGKDEGTVAKDEKDEETVAEYEGEGEETVAKDKEQTEQTVSKDERKDKETVSKDEGKDEETVAKYEEKDEETVSKDKGKDEETVSKDEGKDKESVAGKDEENGDAQYRKHDISSHIKVSSLSELVETWESRSCGSVSDNPCSFQKVFSERFISEHSKLFQTLGSNDQMKAFRRELAEVKSGILGKFSSRLVVPDYVEYMRKLCHTLEYHMACRHQATISNDKLLAYHKQLLNWYNTTVTAAIHICIVHDDYDHFTGRRNCLL